MPTQHDFYEALREGRWQPEIDVKVVKGGYEASYKQGETTVTKTSEWSASQAESDLIEEIAQGSLEGKYFPEG